MDCGQWPPPQIGVVVVLPARHSSRTTADVDKCKGPASPSTCARGLCPRRLLKMLVDPPPALARTMEPVALSHPNRTLKVEKVAEESSAVEHWRWAKDITALTAAFMV